MGQLFDIAEFRSSRAQAEKGPVVDDDFLLNEGLHVLAAYRSIQDLQLRHRLKALIEEIAGLSCRSCR